MRAVPLLALLVPVLWAGTGPAPAAEDPSPLMTKKGKLLVSEDLNAPFSAGWTKGPGTWEVVGGVMRGTERAADMHGAVRRLPVKQQSVIIQYDFRLVGAKMTTLSLNDPKGHLARVLLRPDQFRMQKDDHDKTGPDSAVVFQQSPATFAPEVWHTLIVEFSGDEMLARVGELAGYGRHEQLAAEKTNLGLTVSGDSAEFRRLRVWEALPNPAWESTRSRFDKAGK